MLTYGNRATINFHLNEHNTSESMSDAIDEVKWKDQKTNTSGGIYVMRTQMFTPENGDRDGVPNIGIVITDGAANVDIDRTGPEADLAREEGMSIIVITSGGVLCHWFPTHLCQCTVYLSKR